MYEDRAASVLYKVLQTLAKNQKFLLPLNVCPIVPDTFLKAGVDFCFIDINIDTLCMDESLILNAIQKDKEITGILFVKTFGIDIDIEPLFKKIKTKDTNIFIIDDMCPCIPKLNYTIENSFADMALFSSGYSKYVDLGYGGYAYLKDLAFKDIFKDKTHTKEFLDYKQTLSHKIPLVHAHKQKLNKIYEEHLPSDIFLGDDYKNWRFSILLDNKESILQKIFEVEGLFASSHYPQVDYDYVSHPHKESKAKKVHEKIINLFNDFRFTEEKAHQVIAIIKENIKKKSV